jgi:hypothetical protein
MRDLAGELAQANAERSLFLTYAANPLLFAFATAGGSRLPAARLIEWLHTSVGRAADREQVWREHGNGIAAAELLARIRTRSNREISGDSAALQRFVSLCDDLVRAGVPLAARLRGEVG